jgi:hypothetical protein
MRDLLCQDKCDICGGKYSILQIINDKVFCNKCFRKKVYGVAEIRKKCPFANHTPCQGVYCGVYSETFHGCGLSLLDKFKIDVKAPKAEVSLKVEKDVIPWELAPEHILGETRNNQSQIVTLAQEFSRMKLELEKLKNGKNSEENRRVEADVKPEPELRLAEAVIKANSRAKKSSKRLHGVAGKGKKKKA